MEGWIKIHRQIQKHWIWSDPIKCQWWLDILITVNHTPAKVNIGMQLYECGRGQSIMSLSNWADRWKVSKDKARNFLVLLEKDGMITHESLGKTTRITVCNYDSYQGDLHDSQTITHTNKNEKNDKNDKNEKNNKADAWILKVDEQYREIISMFLDYKKAKDHAYKNEKSFMLMANKLISMSNNNPDVARQIVEQSMSNSWSGLFELKQNNNKSYEQTATRTRKKLY